MSQSSTDSCGNCRFWHASDPLDNQRSGFCRRHPPAVAWQFIIKDGVQAVASNGVFPSVDKAHWCGEWKSLRERMI